MIEKPYRAEHGKWTKENFLSSIGLANVISQADLEEEELIELTWFISETLRTFQC